FYFKRFFGLVLGDSVTRRSYSNLTIRIPLMLISRKRLASQKIGLINNDINKPSGLTGLSKKALNLLSVLARESSVQCFFSLIYFIRNTFIFTIIWNSNLNIDVLQ